MRLAGETAKWHRLRFFLAVLRSRPSFALGYAIVTLVVITGALAPFIAPYGPMVADPNVYLLPPGARSSAGHRRHRHGYFQPRDLCTARRSDHRRDRHISVGGRSAARSAPWPAITRASAHGGPRSAHSSCASADVLQAFPVFVFAIALVAVFGQSVQQHRARDRFREHSDLPAADAQSGAVDPPAALHRGGLCRRRIGHRDPAAPCRSPTRSRRCWRSFPSMSAGRCC